MPAASALVVATFAASLVAAGPHAQLRVDEAAIRDAVALSGTAGEAFASSSAYAHFLTAQLRHHDGELRGAIDELRLALASDDDNPFLRVTLAEEYGRLGELAKAERELRAVIERRPGYAPAQLLLGRVLLEGHKLAKARAPLQKAIALRPREVDAYLVLTQVALEAGEPDEAVRTVEALAKASPGESIGHRRLGLVFAERGDTARAEPLLQYAADTDPQDPEVWIALAQLYDATGRSARAEEAYGRALEQDPDRREVLLEAGRLSLKLGALARAKASFDRLLSLSDEPELSLKVAFAYLAVRQTRAAAELLEGARGRFAEDARLAYYAGLTEERLRRLDRAAVALAAVPAEQRALPRGARAPRHLPLRARASRRGARGVLGRGRSAPPLRPSSIPAHARALERASRAKDAEALVRAALAKAPSPALYEALTGLYERQGRTADAIALLTGALAKRPKDESLLFLLGAVHERAGDTAKAIAAMREVIAVNPDNAAALNFIGYTPRRARRGLRRGGAAAAPRAPAAARERRVPRLARVGVLPARRARAGGADAREGGAARARRGGDRRAPRRRLPPGGEGGGGGPRLPAVARHAHPRRVGAGPARAAARARAEAEVAIHRRRVPLSSAAMPRHDEGFFSAKDNLRLFWESDLPDGEPKAHVAIVHGYGDHAGRYRAFIDALVKQGFGVHAFDYRGHGQADGRRAYVDLFSDYVDDLEAFWRKLSGPTQGKKVFLLAHSQGALIATHWLHHRTPVGLSGVIFSAPYLELALTPPWHKLAAAKVLGRVIPWLQIPSGLTLESLSRDLEWQRSTDRDPLYSKNATPRWFTESTRAQHEALGFGRSITWPFLQLYGSEDGVASPATGKRFFASVASADKTIKEYPGMRHEPLNELGKEEVWGEIARWISAHL